MGPKGSDSHRAAGSMFSSGASEASSEERPVKWNSRQRRGKERGPRETRQNSSFFIVSKYLSHFVFLSHLQPDLDRTNQIYVAGKRNPIPSARFSLS